MLCCKELPTHPLQEGIRLEKGHNGHDVLETRAIGLLFPSCMIPSAPGQLSHKSYEKLSQLMHCSTAENEDPANEITKVHSLITLCQMNYRRCFASSHDISVDEAVIQFDGRLTWKQYLRKKPVKWCSKIWCL